MIAMVSILVVIGAAFICVAAVGVARMPDVYIRLHSSTKAATLGVGFVLIGAILFFAETAVTVRALLVLAFIILTVPLSAHVIGRAAHGAGAPLWSRTLRDDMASRNAPTKEP